MRVCTVISLPMNRGFYLIFTVNLNTHKVLLHSHKQTTYITNYIVHSAYNICCECQLVSHLVLPEVLGGQLGAGTSCGPADSSSPTNITKLRPITCMSRVWSHSCYNSCERCGPFIVPEFGMEETTHHQHSKIVILF